MHVITRIWKNVAGREELRKERRRKAELAKLRPTNATGDDTFIAAFPKSGGTWLSFLIANVNLQINNMAQKVTWWNIREFVFDVHENRTLPANPFTLPRGRFIHTHSEFNETYTRVLYLIRDPRDTLVSYYDLTTKIGWFEGSMDEFLESNDYGIKAWIRHVEGWVRRHTFLSHIHFLRYEDLRSDPVAVLDRIYRLYGIPVERGVFENAVERSSFKAMRESEAEYRKYSFDSATTFQFMRKGRAGSFSEELNAAQTARIDEQCAEWMKLFDYLPYSEKQARAAKPEQAVLER